MGKESAMIRCVRLWTGDDGDSHFEEGTIDLSKGERGDVLSEVVAAASLSFQETKSGGSYEWHLASTGALGEVRMVLYCRDGEREHSIL
jgi:hypothetical protein